MTASPSPRARPGLLFLASLLFCLILPWPAQGSLDHYIRKYKEIKASPAQLKKLRQYDHLITYYANIAYFKPRHKVNADFMRALILAESNANPRAVSKKGARGLTQIMYATGKQAARELLAKKISFRHVSAATLHNLEPDDLHDPALNILLACYIISKYNATYGGKLDLVVSAWNAGENSIKNNKPPNYRETLDLIGKVNGYFVYFLYQGRDSYRYAYRYRK